MTEFVTESSDYRDNNCAAELPAVGFLQFDREGVWIEDKERQMRGYNEGGDPWRHGRAKQRLQRACEAFHGARKQRPLKIQTLVSGGTRLWRLAVLQEYTLLQQETVNQT